MRLSKEVPDLDPPCHSPVSTGAYSALLVLAVGLLAWAMNAPALAPPLGVTAYLCARQPASEVSRPRNIVLGHALGMASGYFALYACQAQSLPSALSGTFTLRHGLASAIAIYLTVWSTERFKTPHPPAAATTLVVSLGLLTTPLAPLSFFVGTLIIVISSETSKRARAFRRFRTKANG